MPENRLGLYLQNDSESWRDFGLVKIFKVLALAFLVVVASPMWATWGIVQQVVGPQVQATSVTTQIPTQITAGNLIVVHVVWSNTSTASVTDTLGNSYVSAGVAQGSANSNLISTQVFYAANAIGGYDRISATIGSSTFLNMYVYEISGAATSNPLDVANVANGTGFSIATGAVSTGAANDLVFAATGHHYASDLPGSGFTGLQANATGLGEYKLVSFAGTSVNGTATLTNTNPSLPWSAVVAAFKSNPNSGPPSTPTLTSIQVTPAYPTLSFNQNQQMFATGTYSDGSMQDVTNSATWASSDISVATLSSSGVASAIGHGSSTITATSGAISGSTPLLVEGSLSSIQITPASGAATAGTTQQFTATGTFTDGSSENISSSVRWSSSNTNVATISAAGLANALAAGNVTITATSGAIASSTGFSVASPPPAVTPPPTGQGPLVQSNYQWLSTYYAGHPPTSGPSACSPVPCMAQTFLNPNTAGNMIFVWVSWNAGISLSSLTDSAGNTYVHIPGYPVANAGSVNDDFWVAYNAAGAANNKITALFATGAATAEPIYMQILEYSGVVTANAFDVTSTKNSHPQCVAPCVLASTPTPTTTQANELVIAVFDIASGPQLTSGAGWIPDATCFSCLGWATDVSGQVVIEHKIASSIGSYTATINDATAGWPAYTAYLFTFRLQP